MKKSVILCWSRWQQNLTTKGQSWQNVVPRLKTITLTLQQKTEVGEGIHERKILQGKVQQKRANIQD